MRRRRTLWGPSFWSSVCLRCEVRHSPEKSSAKPERRSPRRKQPRIPNVFPTHTVVKHIHRRHASLWLVLCMCRLKRVDTVERRSCKRARAPRLRDTISELCCVCVPAARHPRCFCGNSKVKSCCPVQELARFAKTHSSPFPHRGVGPAPEWVPPFTMRKRGAGQKPITLETKQSR